ncbi:hypothetical protein [Xenorhabdus sp. KJ12.1]|uniref:hypothetical protein n=1 Tax=Xenorhabdus sp. KJ12.1 TaxID=1851571 RepID=UPI000C03AA5E|nr:hypothetical protein [Xenorhabdus sp. KJ12.1]PHM72351.1 hypothetical protein Xekj_00630 [Xenorhabdus sp. KJ12.1]
MFFDKNQKKLTEIKNIVTNNNCGIYKRIDENRELLELIYREYPNLIEKNPWVINWIKSQDEFLLAIANNLEINNELNINTEFKYPRKFPQPDR